MTVRIRLSRGGSKKRPFYHVVAADQRCPRDGKYIERLGSYNPMLPKDAEGRIDFDVEKIKAWIAKGAQPTERVQKLMAVLGAMEAPAIREQPKKSQPKAKAQEFAKAKAEKAAAKAEAAKAAAEAPAEVVAEEPKAE